MLKQLDLITGMQAASLSGNTQEHELQSSVIARDDTMEHQAGCDIEQYREGEYFSAFIKDFPASTFLLDFDDPHDDTTGATYQQQQQQQQQQQAPSPPAAVAFTGNGLLDGVQTEVPTPTAPNLMAGPQEQMTATTTPTVPTPNDFSVASMVRSISDDSGYGGSPLESYAASARRGASDSVWPVYHHRHPFPPPVSVLSGTSSCRSSELWKS
ncbi:MAG: hypothetical protein Q9173_006260 [Seirophora scorigena]